MIDHAAADAGPRQLVPPVRKPHSASSADARSQTPLAACRFQTSRTLLATCALNRPRPGANRPHCTPWLLAGAVLLCAAPDAQAQDRLERMPGYDQYQKMNREKTDAVKMGSLTVT